MRKLKIIVTGVGRCGTGFVARYLTSAGLSCGHENFFGSGGLEKAVEILETRWKGRVGDSSWLAAPYLDSEPLGEALVIHLVRHPLDTIRSALKIGDSSTRASRYYQFQRQFLPEMDGMDEPTRVAYRYVHWNRMIEEKLRGRDHIFFRIEDDPLELLEQLSMRGLLDLGKVDRDKLFGDTKYNTKQDIEPPPFFLSDITDEQVRDDLLEITERYGYKWPEEAFKPAWIDETPAVKAVVTTLDNLPILQEAVAVLRDEPIAEIVVVNNGSEDGTREWLEGQSGLTVINRENLGAGPGRNAGLDAAEENGGYDFVLMLDGGIRPLRGGTQRMLDYLLRHPGADVIGVELVDFEPDRDKAWRRWPHPIQAAYHNTRLSHTAYALCRARAFDGLRFSEEGPFGEPGWGVDDDEMAYRWNDAGIAVYVVTCACKRGQPCSGAHPYHNAGGSASRLRRETGVDRAGYGSVYEKRLVMLQQEFPNHEPGLQWGEPWLTVVVQVGAVGATAKIIKAAHDRLRERVFEPPYQHYPNPYSVIAWGGDHKWKKWAEPRRLRQHHGDVIIIGGSIVRRNAKNEKLWTGDFRVWEGEDWEGAVRPNAHYYDLVTDMAELDALIDKYNEAWPRQPVKNPPPVRERLM